MPEARAVVVGDALIDELRDERGVREFPGGAALNVAAGLARLGVPATLIAMVGDDDDGARLRGYLRDVGVELLATPGPLGSSRALSVRTGGEPVYEFNAAARSRRVRFGVAERAAIAQAAVVAVSCFPFDDAAQTADLAAAVGSSVRAIDPNPRTGMMHDLDGFVRGFEALAAGADLVKIGDDDAALLYGEPLEAVCDHLLALGAKAVLTTRGADGAALAAPGVRVALPVTALPGRIVDTMGAGDAAFAAAVAALVSDPPEDADRWAAVLQAAMDVAAATCRFEGGRLRLPAALHGEDLDRLGT